jgi:nucleoside-diphosphate-sugar epimerase
MKVLVTGASGFLGDALARGLVARGDDVHVFQRSACPRLAALGVTVHRGDLLDRGALRRAGSGAEVVFHSAARVGIWGRYEDFAEVNVAGTESVLAVCRSEGVRRLVFTSSASVVFDGTDQEGLDESAPYPSEPLTAYTATKAEAERRILAAAGDDLATISLRPHLVWGPADPHLIGRILLRVRQRRLARVGDGLNRVDTTYIENAVAAHLLADERLAAGAPCNGKAYFITDGDPRTIDELMNNILKAADLPRPRRSISVRTALAAGAFTEWLYRTFKIEGEPEVTRFLVLEFTKSHWFEIGAARRDLGYEPPVSVEDGLRRLRSSFFPEWPEG